MCCYVLFHTKCIDSHKIAPTPDTEPVFMRFLPLSSLAALSLMASPAVAQTSNADTYKEVVAHGVTLMIPDMPIDVTFTPDGKFTAMNGVSTGVWKIAGDRLCTTPNETLIENCAVYPAGKKSGDTFDVPTPGGAVSIKIR